MVKVWAIRCGTARAGPFGRFQTGKFQGACLHFGTPLTKGRIFDIVLPWIMPTHPRWIPTSATPIKGCWSYSARWSLPQAWNGKEKPCISPTCSANPGEFGFYISCTEDQRLIRTFHLLRVFRETLKLLVHKDLGQRRPMRRPTRFSSMTSRSSSRTTGPEGCPRRSGRFVSIARAIPTLFFGSAGRARRLLEYAFRIDPKFGLFFCTRRARKADALFPRNGG